MAKPVSPVRAAESALRAIAEGLDGKKCRRCGRMAKAVAKASLVFAASDDPAVRALQPRLDSEKARLGTTSSDSMGCSDCHGKRALRELSKLPRGQKAESEEVLPKRIEARIAPEIRPDPVGTCTVRVEGGQIVCERTSRSGRLTHVIVGTDPDAIVAAAVKKGLVSKLEHAARLGADLAAAKAQL